LYINGALTETENRNTTLDGLGNNLQVGRLGTHGRLEASLDEFAIGITISPPDLETSKTTDFAIKSGSLVIILLTQSFSTGTCLFQ